MARDRMKRPGRGDPNDRALRILYGDAGVSGGNALINKFLVPGSLGRVGTDLPGAEGNLKRFDELYDKYSVRDPAQQKVLDQMKAGLGGYTSPEYQAQREQMMRGQQSNLQTGLSQLAKAQSRGKVYGAAAAAQQGNLLRSSEQSKNQLEQDLYVKNIDEMQRRLSEYGQYNRGLADEEYGRVADIVRGKTDESRSLREEELDRQKINIGQSNAELAAQIGAFTGAGATSLQEKNLKEARKIQRRALRALNN